MLRHRQGKFLLDGPFVFIEGHPRHGEGKSKTTKGGPPVHRAGFPDGVVEARKTKPGAPGKMTALLQAPTGSEKRVLLHYDTNAGHSGGTPLPKQIENTTNELSFLMWQLGMTGTSQAAEWQK